MSGPDTHAAHTDDGTDHGTRRSYLIGFLLAAALTVVPFWLVMTATLAPVTTAVIITLLAIIQIVVHTVFFLHVNARTEGGWTLVSLVFTAIMILIVICGSLWIMYHLHGNMMPTPPPAEVVAAAPMGAVAP